MCAGEAATYTNFETDSGKGQRADTPGQPYTFLRPSSGQWQFEPDSYRYVYVCRLPAGTIAFG